MISNIEITIDELEKIIGGTISESTDLVIPLAARGHGVFIKSNYDAGRNAGILCFQRIQIHPGLW